MIIILLSILTMLLIVYGTYRVAEKVLSLPRSEMREVIRDLPGRRNFSQRLEERILTPIAKLISKACHSAAVCLVNVKHFFTKFGKEFFLAVVSTFFYGKVRSIFLNG